MSGNNFAADVLVKNIDQEPSAVAPDSSYLDLGTDSLFVMGLVVSILTGGPEAPAPDVAGATEPGEPAGRAR